MDKSATLRPITELDKEFLYQVYASTREEELELTGWDDLRKGAFLQMQFDAQHRFYMEQFATAEFQIVLLNREPVGRLYVDRRPDEIRIVDIALLPQHRNQGIGSRLMGDLCAEAEGAGFPVRIHVERSNRVLRLYHRFGFRKIGDTGVYYLMEWTPGPKSS